MNELTNGTKLQNGRYKITGKLGEGGFGITYSGTTKVSLTGNLGTSEGKMQVAIKEFFMPTKCQRETDGRTVSVPVEENRDQVEKYKKKFRKEAESLSKIEHRNIVRVSEVFDENGTVYYVMSHLGGGSLADRVRYAPQGRLDEAEATTYARQIAAALSYLHHRTICHLDVKPANILLNDDGEAVLIDFGISKTFGDTEVSTQSVTYTNHYAPLEQYSPITDFSPQTDIYSLSATLFFMVTGQLPPEASEMMNEGLPPRPDNVTLRTWKTITEGMKPKRSDRPQTVEQWLTLLDGQEHQAPPQPGNDGGATIIGNRQASSASASSASAASGQNVQGGYTGETVVGDEMPVNVKKPKPTNTKTDNLPPKPGNTKPSKNQTWLYVGVFVGALVLGAVVYWLITIPDIVGKSRPVVRKYTPEQVMTQLGRTDITLDSVELFMANMEAADTPTATLDSINRRAYAMRQLLGPCFRNVPHRLADLKGIYVANTKYISPGQMRIFLWFFNRPIQQLNQWEKMSEPVSTLDDFQTKMEKQFNE